MCSQGGIDATEQGQTRLEPCSGQAQRQRLPSSQREGCRQELAGDASGLA